MNGYIYLLHFVGEAAAFRHRPISPKHTCQHYLGYTTDLAARLAAHRAGTGARLCEVAKERGIGFHLARVWRGDRHLERKLKNRKSSPRLCYCCNGNLDFTLDDVEKLEF